jgi:hypothetical protein
MVDLWWLFYAIFAAIGLTLWQTPQLNWTNSLDISSLTNTTDITTKINSYDYNIELCGIVIAVFLVGRIFVLSIGYALYFIGKGPEMALKGSYVDEAPASSKFESERGTDLEDNLIKKPKSKKGKKKKSRSKQLREEHNFEMEGGSSEEERKQKKSSKSKSRTGASSRSKDKQIIGMAAEPLPKKKSGTRYEEYEKGSSSRQSKMKVDHNSSSENKNLVDIIGEINEKTQQKKLAKRQVNDSGIKSASSNRRSESPSEQIPKGSIYS